MIYARFLRRFLYFCRYGTIAGTIKNTKSMININDLLESTAERRARRNKDIKTYFQHLAVDRHMPCMDAYEVVGYQFYESAERIRKILHVINKSGQNDHRPTG